jgi:Eco29kI restriction endonuclease
MNPEEKSFNPLDRENLGKSVVDALYERPVIPLANIKSFIGAGVYAIYYSPEGRFKPYQYLADLAKAQGPLVPIYVGKAIPTGGRKGVQDASLSDTSLYKRLAEHQESIRSVENLEIDWFYARYIIVEDIWIPLGESLLIQQYRPIWNVLVEGFGNHDPGAGRYKGKRPVWDEIHPGRVWASRCQPPKWTKEETIQRVDEYMTQLKAVATPKT